MHPHCPGTPFDAMATDLPPLRPAIAAAHRRDERTCVAWLQAQQLAFDAANSRATDAVAPQPEPGPAADALARRLVQAVRAQRRSASGVDALMQEFSLNSEEGVALMCLAEALLRIPDAATADRLITDKLGKGDWRRHLGESPSLFVNAATWGLLITGRLVATRSEHGMQSALMRLLAKGGEPLIRRGVDLAMRMLGNQFVAGQTIAAALANGSACEARGYQYSYDMLGEGALTAEDARRYFDAYVEAIDAIGAAAGRRGIHDGPGISVKLSALHPRYGRAQRERVMAELLPRLQQLVRLARDHDIGINIDAEEADRLELSLDLLEALAFDPNLAGFDGLGFVVQAYQKRCPYVIDHLADLARRSGRRFMVRLVKGAYWDSEIKRAQVDGMTDYPVYTRKVHTDMSYLVCARKLLAHADLLYPQFATHNAHTLATVHAWAARAGVVDYEFQCLHGMGETLYDQVVGPGKLGARCRIYAPVGPHRTLLAYLVRRLLENGANSSFVNRLVDPAVGIDELVADPFSLGRATAGSPHPQIVLPAALYGPGRENSGGVDFNEEFALLALERYWRQAGCQRFTAAPMVGNVDAGDAGDAGGVHGADEVAGADASLRRLIRNPADHDDVVGDLVPADGSHVEAALAGAAACVAAWQAIGSARRAQILRRAADLLQAQRNELMLLSVREAGKTWPNAAGEVREAVDFLRYYAAQAETSPAAAALGVVACISPWNFPLAIFVGQVAAALAAGNAVLAKPAEQTPLIAARAVALLHQAGVPRGVLQFLPGGGVAVGAALVADRRVSGVVFTGSTAVAKSIHRVLAARRIAERREIVLIAETGGQNAMIVDSSALPEQVVQDVLTSAFDSAGQRCSALRVLCLQDEIADEVLRMLRGALAERSLGDPVRLRTDIGPVIDAPALARLCAHVERMRAGGAVVTQMPVPHGARDALARGTFVIPAIIEIASMSVLTHEVFGPVLHVLRFRRDRLDALIDSINATGNGLTLGIHSRIDETIDAIVARARVGNVYVNRTIIGAAVGSQPFGGQGLSGTGPKAGGPLYLRRLQCSAPSAPGMHDADASALPVSPQLPALPALPTALLAWLRSQQEGVDADIALFKRSQTTPDSIALPGPTGESNTLKLLPRGLVLCLAQSRAGLLQQLEAIFMTGNSALLSEGCAALLAQRLPSKVAAHVRIVSQDDIVRETFDAVLLEGSFAEQWGEKLADREGALLYLQITKPGSNIDLYQLVCEQTLTVNTTAAGGNAHLMTIDN